MPTKISFQVTKQHPYTGPDTAGQKKAQEFYALVQALAAKPLEIYHLREKQEYFFKAPDGNTYVIEKILLSE